jgi:hypothetical protein
MKSENGGRVSLEETVPHDFIAQADREWRRINQPPRESPAAKDAASILLHAASVVSQRRANYGPPREHFQRTVGMLNALFAHKLKEPFTVEEWPQIMLCDKLSRHQEKPIADNPLDCAGYAACWSECLAGDSQQ